VLLITNNDDHAVSQIYVDVKGIMMAEAAFSIDGCFCRSIKKLSCSLSLNSVSRKEPDLTSINSS
jgi:hypothetical protein